MLTAEGVAIGVKSPGRVDTVVVGNGPSALILSYILHGHIPTYDLSHPHPDPLLHAKLRDTADLLHLDVDHLTEHFPASRFSYSTQALAINVLLDTLVRPNGDTAVEGPKTCIRWVYRPERAVSHVVFGNTAAPGGQWEDNPVDASWEIGTLSYGGMLSLPGYSYEEHYQKTHQGQVLQPYTRPSRRQVAGYFATYPEAVAIQGSIRCGETLEGISRTPDGFYIQSHGLSCKHLVLATGIFSELIPARPLLQPLLHLPAHPPGRDSPPLLVVGSGFTAADVIISTPPKQKIIHIFKWAPDTRPSPLRACHQDAYPEYAGVYKMMRVAANAYERRHGIRPKIRRGNSTPFLEGRDWERVYEGLPNTAIVDVQVQQKTALVTFEGADGVRFQRKIGSLVYVVGRRGSLNYLTEDLKREVLGSECDSSNMISGQTLREKATHSTEVAPDVFITGSLTGDSLVRFSYGGVTFAAGCILDSDRRPSSSSSTSSSSSPSSYGSIEQQAAPRKDIKPAMNGMAGHNSSSHHVVVATDDDHECNPNECNPNECNADTVSMSMSLNDNYSTLDRRKELPHHHHHVQDASVAERKASWQESGWWGGGICHCLVSPSGFPYAS